MARSLLELLLSLENLHQHLRVTEPDCIERMLLL